MHSKMSFDLGDIDRHDLNTLPDSSFEAAYAFPNGYFTCDLNPMENAFLSRLLSDEFGYNLIGVGTACLAFKKSRELNQQEKSDLINVLDKVYCQEFDTKLKLDLSSSLSDNQVIILNYTE